MLVAGRQEAVRAGMTVRRAVPAGLLDAGLASLASFSATSYATRFLAPADLGTYALFLGAFLMGVVVSTQLLFSPAEIASLRYNGARRLRLLDQSLLLGSLPALGAAIAAVLAAIVGSVGAPGDVVVPLALTSGTCALVGPVQDHVRRLLHFAGYSWRAAAMSATLLGTVLASLLLLHRFDVDPIWVPFGSLSVANAISLLTGLLLVAGQRRNFEGLERLKIGQLIGLGRWLVLIGLTPTAAIFVAGVLVTKIASATDLGYVQAAGLLSQPMYVLTVGLSAVLGPRLLQAGAERSSELAHRTSRLFRIGLVTAALAYTLGVGFRWPLNPLPHVVPSAYVVGGLLPLLIIGQTLQGMLQPSRSQLTGAGWVRTLLRLELSSSIFFCLGSASAGVLGPFAMALGSIAWGVVGLYLFGRASRRLYLETTIPAEDKIS
jgi:O-antigen/teichoic acid export membrane protein